MTGTNLENLKELKLRADGERVTLRARVLRFWEVGGLRMALVGDESALVRVEIRNAALQQQRSYEFRNALVKTYPGGWHSVSLNNDGRAVILDHDVPISQSEAYIERTFKILSGVQRKKGRAAGRVQPWSHPRTGRTDQS